MPGAAANIVGLTAATTRALRGNVANERTASHFGDAHALDRHGDFCRDPVADEEHENDQQHQRAGAGADELIAAALLAPGRDRSGDPARTVSRIGITFTLPLESECNGVIIGLAPLRSAGSRSNLRAATGSRSARHARSAVTPDELADSAAAGASAWMAVRGNSEQRSPIPKRRTGTRAHYCLPSSLPRRPVRSAFTELDCTACAKVGTARELCFCRGKSRDCAGAVGARRLSARERRTATGHSRTLFAADTVQSPPCGGPDLL